MMINSILVFTILAAFLIVVLLAPICIPFLHKLKFGQSIREEGPQSHFKKAGTPTMGGIIILIAITFTVFKFAELTPGVALLLLVTLGYGFIGFLDDFIKIYLKQNLGLTAKQKLFSQLILAFVFYYFLIRAGHSTAVFIPGTEYGVELGPFFTNTLTKF